MSEKEITVRYVNYPKDAATKDWGSIKSAENDIFWGETIKLKQFQPNEVCVVKYSVGKQGHFRIESKASSSNGHAEPLPKTTAPLPQAHTNGKNTLPSLVEQFMKILLDHPEYADWPAENLQELIDRYRVICQNTIGKHND